MRYILISVLLYVIGVLNAQTYEGVIGEYEIFLTIDKDCERDYIEASYFYKSQLKNVFLDGECKDSIVVLFEKYSDIDSKKELFILKLSNHIISGTWEHGTQKLEVELVETTQNLELFKSNKLNFIRDTISQYREKELVWFTEKRSGKKLFRLGNGFTKQQRESINPLLDSIQKEYALTELNCNYFDVNIEVEFVSNDYLSFSEFSSVYCGGAHPNYNTNGYNFDLVNNKMLGELKDSYPNQDLFLLLKDKYENGSGLDSECEYFEDRHYWEYGTWVFTEKGILITPSYPHVMTPCETGFLLTFKELE